MPNAKDGAARTGRKREPDAGEKDAGVEVSIIHLLHRASQRASEVFAEATKDYDITARQYAVIATIATHRGLSQTELVRITGVDRSTLADVVKRLLRRGIIQRERTAHDGRAYAVELSPEGEALYKSIEAKARKADKAVLKPLREAERKKLRKSLGIVIGSFEPLSSLPNGHDPVKDHAADIVT